MMKQELHPHHDLLEKCNIKWIKFYAHRLKFVTAKVPFLAAVITQIEIGQTVAISLKDPSGEIEAYVTLETYKEHQAVFAIGAVVVLKQFGVLSTCHYTKHYLIVTVNNLSVVYGKRNERRESEWTQVASQGTVEAQSFSEISYGGIVKECGIIESEQNFEARKFQNNYRVMENTDDSKKSNQRVFEKSETSKNIFEQSDIQKQKLESQQKVFEKSENVKNLKNIFENELDEDLDTFFSFNTKKVCNKIQKVPKRNVTESQSSQLSLMDSADSQIVQEMLSGIDPNSFLDDDF